MVIWFSVWIFLPIDVYKSVVFGKNCINFFFTGKMPVLKHESSQYISDIQNLLVRNQCADVIFCTEELRPISGAHRVVLCSVSAVFSLLFLTTTERDISNSYIYRTAHSLFSVYEESADTAHNSPVRVIVKDYDFHMCLPHILHFIYSGITSTLHFFSFYINIYYLFYM